MRLPIGTRTFEKNRMGHVYTERILKAWGRVG